MNAQTFAIGELLGSVAAKQAAPKSELLRFLSCTPVSAVRSDEVGGPLCCCVR